jgi:hypothetical protein
MLNARFTMRTAVFNRELCIVNRAFSIVNSLKDAIGFFNKSE